MMDAYASLMAHADDIATAVRAAPSGRCVRAEANRDGTWRGVRVLTQADRDDPDQQEPIDGVAHIFDADAAASSAAIVAELREWIAAS
jgi:hypothetical protein